MSTSTTSQFQSFYPPARTLMGPGPTDTPPRVMNALARPTIGHLDPQFIQMMDQLKGLLQYTFQTKNEHTLAISAPGSAGMEACFVNLIEPGDKVIVCINGVFGQRMFENAKRSGAEVVVVDVPWGRAIPEARLRETLEANPDTRIVSFVHAETSTGAMTDAEALCKLAKDYDCLTIVDAVTSLGGIPVKVDEWQIDAIYSGSQKCLSCIPGLSPISFSTQAVAKINARKTPVQSWFLDQTLLMSYWHGDSKRTYHHTAPVNALYALHEALLLIWEEGIENVWQRHADQHNKLRAGLEKMGLSFIVPEGERLPQLNTIHIPEAIDDVTVRSYLLNHYNLEIGAGLGKFAGHAWRIGLLGYGARNENVALCLKALEEAIEKARA
ncbi:MAG: alanine--glyoxylate aminotransferase [Gammaproteobacteria bacterium]|nr:MAG: alanine--glyoxylate aminotransferase [Gammaproteobacteria bacterium]